MTALSTLGLLSAIINLGFAANLGGFARMAVDVAIVTSIWWRGSRGGLVLIGSLLAVMGIVIAIPALVDENFSTVHRTLLIIAAFIWIGSGLLFLTSLDIRAFLDSRAALRRHVADSDDRRWGSSQGAQIVGRPCGVCDKRFATERAAVLCETCAIPFHDGACLRSHRDNVHRGAGSIVS